MPEKTWHDICPTCGTVQGVHEYIVKLWDLHGRRKDGKQNLEPLVYFQSDMEELGFYDDEEMHDSIMMSMERNMHERGLCPTCGLPDLTGLTADDFHDEEDMQELREMWAEQEAERRMGC